MTGAALRMTWPYLERWDGKNARRHWYEAGSALGFHQLSIFEGSLAELLRFFDVVKNSKHEDEASQIFIVLEL